MEAASVVVHAATHSRHFARKPRKTEHFTHRRAGAPHCRRHARIHGVVTEVLHRLGGRLVIEVCQEVFRRGVNVPALHEPVISGGERESSAFKVSLSEMNGSTLWGGCSSVFQWHCARPIRYCLGPGVRWMRELQSFRHRGLLMKGLRRQRLRSWRMSLPIQTLFSLCPFLQIYYFCFCKIICVVSF